MLSEIRKNENDKIIIIIPITIEIKKLKKHKVIHLTSGNGLTWQDDIFMHEKQLSLEYLQFT